MFESFPQSRYLQPDSFPTAAVVFGVFGFRLDGHVGEGDAVFGDDQSDVEGGFRRWFIPAWKRPSSISGLELSASQDALFSVGGLVIAAVESLDCAKKLIN